ncbi:hypothetical protein FAVG1_10900 [Fusarium avenaceum]|nr:hypothetical protein FAVG1_10900 [Fusarium avenaceum]
MRKPLLPRLFSSLRPDQASEEFKGGPGYQAKFAKAIKRAVGDKMPVSTDEMINKGVEDDRRGTGGGYCGGGTDVQE